LVTLGSCAIAAMVGIKRLTQLRRSACAKCNFGETCRKRRLHGATKSQLSSVYSRGGDGFRQAFHFN